MFQAPTFDPKTLARELTWASDLGFNFVRVFLHDLLWELDGEGFLNRVDQFLGIANSAQVGTMLVLFDGCWDPAPQPGLQLPPRPRIHNSRWAQSPGAAVLEALPAHEARLKRYVQAVIRRFANDSRVLLWDLYNQPDDANANNYGMNGTRVPAAADAKGKELPPLTKTRGARDLLQKTFAWAWEVDPSQPLTAAVFDSDVGDEADALRRETQAWMLNASDVVSFHNYESVSGMSRQIAELQQRGRPLICSEYMARSVGSTFDPILGLLEAEDVWGVNWGFVSGRSQTIYPWDSWSLEYTGEPTPWLHDVLRRNGTPYSESEASYIRGIQGSGIQLLSI